MNPHSGMNGNNIRKTKLIAAVGMAGIIFTAALMSGLVPFMGSSYQPAIAQTGNATTTTGGGQFPCAPAQTVGGGGQNQNTSTTATTMGGAASTDTNTTGTTAEGDQAIGELAIHIQEACLAAQNNDIPGVLLHLNLALGTLNALRGEGATNATAALEERGLILERGLESGEVGSEGGAEVEG
jgi:hypothetical protein